MASKLQIDFVRSLVNKTNEKKIPWTIDGSSVYAHIGELTVLISSEEGYRGALVKISVLRDGFMIDHMTDEDFTDFDLVEFGVESSFALMTRLYDNARRQALGADDALQYLLDKLAS